MTKTRADNRGFFEMIEEPLPRWRQRLEKELAFRPEFTELDEGEWRKLLKTRKVSSSNHDTVLSLDWPHFCAHSTPSCGGPQGWCYTFQGNQAGKLHNRHAAMVDVLARSFPNLFAEKVEEEVGAAVHAGHMPYANLRYSGSGEVVEAYLPALRAVMNKGVHLWGFTRDLRLAKALREMGAGVIISCDRTSPEGFIDKAVKMGFTLGYTSTGVEDLPPKGTVVTFPVHRIGRVREVVDSKTVCPKVLADFLDDCRPPASCQQVCKRCHQPKTKP
jgi:hypothetical protein